MGKVSNSHTFVICAYGKSPYLEDCILSLKEQTVSSEIMICTSTPNEMIDSLGKKYGIRIMVNTGEKGITQDWNFALSNVSTRYGTIAHQDDIYDKNYAYIMIETMQRSEDPLIGFSDYGELHNGNRITDTGMLKIKRLMLKPLKAKQLWKSRFIRRRILSMGDPISCPSVTFCLDNVKQPVFRNHFRSCEDWEAWENLSKEKGSFVYIPECLMYHRIHEESETSKIINDGARIAENYEMFRKFWPAPVAKLINKLYTGAEKYNQE